MIANQQVAALLARMYCPERFTCLYFPSGPAGVSYFVVSYAAHRLIQGASMELVSRELQQELSPEEKRDAVILFAQLKATEN